MLICYKSEYILISAYEKKKEQHITENLNFFVGIFTFGRVTVKWWFGTVNLYSGVLLSLITDATYSRYSSETPCCVV